MPIVCTVQGGVFTDFLQIHTKYSLDQDLTSIHCDINGYQGANFSFYCVNSTDQKFQPIFFKFIPKIHWTKIQTPIHFCHPLVTFVATSRSTQFFTVWNSFQLIFFKFTPNFQLAMVQTPVHCLHPFLTFVAAQGPTSALLCALYKAEFSTDLLQFHTKYLLCHDLDSKSTIATH